jgi:predicted ATPase
VLSLSPLEDSDLLALITAIVDDPSSELSRVVLERAGGSPLYAEQLAAMLTEQTLATSGGLDE